MILRRRENSPDNVSYAAHPLFGHFSQCRNSSGKDWTFGAPGEIRTPDPQIRSLVLDPVSPTSVTALLVPGTYKGFFSVTTRILCTEPTSEFSFERSVILRQSHQLQ